MEQALIAHLLAWPSLAEIVGNRITPAPAPQKSVLPRVTLTLLSAPRTARFDGWDTCNAARLQIDGWARTYAQASAVGHAVAAALEAPFVEGESRILGAFLINERSLVEADPEGPVHRRNLIFRIWSKPS